MKEGKEGEGPSNDKIDQQMPGGSQQKTTNKSRQGGTATPSHITSMTGKSRKKPNLQAPNFPQVEGGRDFDEEVEDRIRLTRAYNE
jgi:hypothetical protein